MSLIDKSPIVIWKVGCPHEGTLPKAVIPDFIAERAMSLNAECQIQCFVAHDFHVIFAKALLNKRLPDVLVVDNNGIMAGIKTALGRFIGVQNLIDQGRWQWIRKTLDRFLPGGRGWVYLIEGSPNHATASKLAYGKPLIPAKWPESYVSPDADEVAIREVACQAVRAYADRDVVGYWRLLDPDHMVMYRDGRVPMPAHFENVHVAMDRPIKIGRIWANNQLAFCGAVYAYVQSPNEPRFWGGERAVVVLRRTAGTWRVMFVSIDPAGLRDLEKQIPELVRDLQPKQDLPVEAALTSPFHNLIVPRPSPDDELGENDDRRFGLIKWTRPGNHIPYAELVEMTYDTADQFDEAGLISSTRAFVLPVAANSTKGQISTGRLWSPNSRWQFRVWSIAADGGLAFSAWQEFFH